MELTLDEFPKELALKDGLTPDELIDLLDGRGKSRQIKRETPNQCDSVHLWRRLQTG